MKTIRLWATARDGSERIQDFDSLSDAREALTGVEADWVIFKLPEQSQRFDRAVGLQVLDSSAD